MTPCQILATPTRLHSIPSSKQLGYRGYIVAFSLEKQGSLFSVGAEYHGRTVDRRTKDVYTCQNGIWNGTRRNSPFFDVGMRRWKNANKTERSTHKKRSFFRTERKLFIDPYCMQQFFMPTYCVPKSKGPFYILVYC